MHRENRENIEPIGQDEITELVEKIYDKYGYDFRDYSRAHVKRRIINRMIISDITNIKSFQSKILSDTAFASLCVNDLSIKVTEMFRDPAFYLMLREKVIPILKTYSFVKIWHAGGATGEEIYSMAILLKEENLYDRCLIYATDFNQEGINQGKEGIYLSEKVKGYSKNYQLSGGKASFSDYYTCHYDRIIMNKQLKSNIVWANHNLVTDSVFAEVHLIFCRNVLIYFNKDLQERVHSLFTNSLVNGGVLCLGIKENLQYSNAYPKFSVLDSKSKIYRKKYQSTKISY